MRITSEHRFLPFALFASCALACTSSAATDGGPQIHASDYDQSCITASDCAAIIEGRVCGCVGPNAAINVRDLAREEADAKKAFQQCPPSDVECTASLPSVPVCTDGKCGIHVCGPYRCDDAGADAASPAECATDVDCPGSDLCVASHCRAACTSDAQCPGGPCDTSVCRGPKGCNPPPDGSACPLVCVGVCGAPVPRDAAAD